MVNLVNHSTVVTKNLEKRSMKGKAVNHVKVLYELVNKCGEVCDDRQNGILEVKSGKIALTKTSSIATTVDSVPMVGGQNLNSNICSLGHPCDLPAQN